MTRDRAAKRSRVAPQSPFPSTERDWADLVDARRWQLSRFLLWAAERETVDSMRLSNRADIRRTRAILDSFDHPWWAVVVYTCFDSEVGTRAVADVFHSPIEPWKAERFLSELDLPSGAVQHHRTQPGHKGARIALLSACLHSPNFEQILLYGNGFHDRYEALRRLRAKQWGRTTCFDLLFRAGHLGLGSSGRYAPDRAYLADSTGPRKGFEKIWGIGVTRSNAALPRIRRTCAWC